LHGIAFGTWPWENLSRNSTQRSSPPPASGTRQSVLFSPPILQCSRVAPTAEDRFYSSSLTLADGRLMTLFGSGSKSIEVYNRGTSTWSPAIATPAQMAQHQY